VRQKVPGVLSLLPPLSNARGLHPTLGATIRSRLEADKCTLACAHKTIQAAGRLQSIVGNGSRAIATRGKSGLLPVLVELRHYDAA
jgi:hypothetical protein